MADELYSIGIIPLLRMDQGMDGSTRVAKHTAGQSLRLGV